MQEKNKEKQTKAENYTSGNIKIAMIRLSIPLILGNILQQLYNTIDAWVVGKFAGTEEFAAIGVAAHETGHWCGGNGYESVPFCDCRGMCGNFRTFFIALWIGRYGAVSQRTFSVTDDWHSGLHCSCAVGICEYADASACHEDTEGN